MVLLMSSFFFQAEDGIRDSVASRGLGDVYKRQYEMLPQEIRDNLITCSFPWKFGMKECGECNKCKDLVAVKKACEEW